MKTRINVAELLRNCPRGMELDCTMFENLYFDYIDDSLNDLCPIRCYIKQSEAQSVVRFTKYGTYTLHPAQKCVIFPKGKNTWEGFVPPVEFKDGDIVCTTLNSIAIIKDKSALGYTVYCAEKEDGDFYFHVAVTPIRLATEEERQKLFKAIKDNGYRWDAERKCLEKLEPQYPKTYKECCDILGLDTMVNDAQ